jgi:hypothetical protein
MSPSFEPLLLGQRSARARDILEGIVNALAARDPLRSTNCCWSGGAAGLATLFDAHAKLWGDTKSRVLSTTWLERAEELLAEETVVPGLYGGVAGVGWTGAYLQGVDVEEDPAADLDEALVLVTSHVPYDRPYDIIEGLAGMGIYALERIAIPSAQALLAQVIARLDETSCASHGGWGSNLAWIPPEVRAGRSEHDHDLGVAHGAAGTLPVIAAAVAHDVARARALALYRRTRDFVFSHRLDQTDASFPAMIRAGEVAQRTRGAWCYGDPGMAAALHAAARAVGDKELEERAIDVAEKALLRPMDEWAVHDAAFCHGASGIAHCYHRLFRASGRERLREAALSWFDVVLGMHQPGKGVGGYQAFDEAKSPPAFRDVDGVLEGAAGIGLALSSALSSEDSGWDRPFALSTTLDIRGPGER